MVLSKNVWCVCGWSDKSALKVLKTLLKGNNGKSIKFMFQKKTKYPGAVLELTLNYFWPYTSKLNNVKLHDKDHIWYSV